MENVPLHWKSNTARPQVVPGMKGRGGVKLDSVEDVSDGYLESPQTSPSPSSPYERQAAT